MSDTFTSNLVAPENPFFAESENLDVTELEGELIHFLRGGSIAPPDDADRADYDAARRLLCERLRDYLEA